MSVPQAIRPFYSIHAELAGAQTLDPYMPYVVGAMVSRIEHEGTSGGAVTVMGVALQTDAGGVTAEDGEAHASRMEMSSQWKWHPNADPSLTYRHQTCRPSFVLVVACAETEVMAFSISCASPR